MMKKYLRSFLFFLGVLLLNEAAFAANFCNDFCNRVTCRVTEVQKLCKRKCPEGAENCLKATAQSLQTWTETNPGVIKQFCSKGCNRFTCANADAGKFCQEACRGPLSDSIKNCLKAAGLPPKAAKEENKNKKGSQKKDKKEVEDEDSGKKVKKAKKEKKSDNS